VFRLFGFCGQYVLAVPVNQLGQGVLFGFGGFKVAAFFNRGFRLLFPAPGIGDPLKGCRLCGIALKPD